MQGVKILTNSKNKKRGFFNEKILLGNGGITSRIQHLCLRQHNTE